MGKSNKIAGFGVIEILVAAAVIGTVIFSLFNVFVLADRLSEEAGDKIRANFLAEEALEVVRYLRDRSWEDNISNLNTGTSYYLAFSGATSRWSIGTSNPGLIDGLFTRTVTVENVSRDSNDDIVLAGGTDDPKTKKINVTVSWTERGAPQSLMLSIYLTDIYLN